MVAGLLGLHAPAVPLSVAVLAGALTTLNPCSVPLLPAYVSSYVGADERRLPGAPTALVQGALVGLSIAAGTVSVFAAIGIPLLYGATFLTDAIPYAGLGAGVGLGIAGLVVLTRGRLFDVSGRSPCRLGGGRWFSLALFGVGYGVASLGCGLPVFLALVAATLATDGSGPALVVFCAFAAGMTLTFTVLAVAAALVRDGLARRLRFVLPRMRWISGSLLLLSGAYLGYYWARVRFGPQATLADDPIVGTATRYSARIQTLAGQQGAWLILVSTVGLCAALGVSLRNARRRSKPSLPPRAPLRDARRGGR